MKFDFEIKNLGKVKHAKMKLAPFTIIAGANSSGKSFVSRALYSFFSTINKDHITADALSKVTRARSLLKTANSSTNSPSSIVKEYLSELSELLVNLSEEINSQFGENTYIEQFSRSVIIEETILDIESAFEELLTNTANKKKYFRFNDRIDAAIHSIDMLKQHIKKPSLVLSEKFTEGFNDALKENFQVPNLSDLKSFDIKNNEPISFDFGKLGQIQIHNEDIKFSITSDGVDAFQSLYNVVFIESPIYWKLRKPLLKAKFDSFDNIFRNLHRESDSLSGIPKYFFDLIDLVDENIKSNDRSENLLKELELNLSDTLGGELDISDSGDIFFKDFTSSKNININLTATGTTNLGLIGLLLKRNVIAKGSFIFVDEPEVNLHPAWQKIMIDTLYQLSQRGINVVIASHSIDMMKYIDNIMASLDDSNIAEHFAINRLSPDGISVDEDISASQSIAKIQDELGTPFYEMVLESDW